MRARGAVSVVQAAQRVYRNKEMIQLMNSEQTMIFSDNLCAIVLLGMLQSVKDLIILSKSEEKRNFQMGFVTSAIILGGHTGELLLKYKLEREETPFKRNHDLYELYELLKDESKVAIQDEFEALLSEGNTSSSNLPNGWHNTESVFNSARLSSVEWRYLIETNPKKPRQSPDINPDILYTAVLSVFRTTPLIHSRTTFETIAIEDLPPDVRARAMAALK